MKRKEGKLRDRGGREKKKGREGDDINNFFPVAKAPDIVWKAWNVR